MTTSSARAKTPDSVKETPKIDEVSDSDAAPEPKCENHPHRIATLYTQDGAIEQYLCDECAPSWYK